jgi:carboxymethylenebutenolidase
MYNNPLPRRVFLRRLAAAGVLPAVLENAHADPVARDDARLETGYMEYGGLRCYVARPWQRAAKSPVVIVVADNGGLNAHIEHVARRAGVAGFAAVAPELRSPEGDTPHLGETLASLLPMVDDLAARPESGKLGCIGFAWGGGMASQLAVHSSAIVAASSFYGPAPDAVDVPRIKARLLLHYAERDERINTAVPAYEAALKAAGVQHVIHVYPGTDHAFHDDTAGARYNQQAAMLAWTRTITFLKDALR